MNIKKLHLENRLEKLRASPIQNQKLVNKTLRQMRKLAKEEAEKVS